MRQIQYLGPYDAFDSKAMFEKRYQFTSPGEHALDAFDRRWSPSERGQPVAVNNADADELLTKPWPGQYHRFVEVAEQPTTPAAPAAPDVAPSAEGKQ